MYCAYITKISNLHKHSNADRLMVGECFGNQVVVGLDANETDLIVYFPTDGQLSLEYAEANNLLRKKGENGKNIGGYMDANKRNVTTVKLRGECSDGLVMPITSLEAYTDITKLKAGDTITTLNGHLICEKYIPNNTSFPKTSTKTSNNKKPRKVKKVKEQFPNFEEHIDTQQLAYNHNAFKEGDIIYLTQKLHGTSFRVSNTIKLTTTQRPEWIKKLFHIKDKETKQYNIVSGTRRMVLMDYKGGFYGSNEFRKKYNDMFIDKLPKGMTVYGEIVGWINENTPIMSKCSNAKVNDKEFSRQYGAETIFTYGCEAGENKCYIYRLTMTNEDGVTIELPTEETIRWCEKLGVEYVPLLDKFLYTTWEDLNNRCKPYLDVPEPLSNGKHVTEGVVVRIDNRSKFTAYKTKSFYFKVLEGLIKSSVDTPDIEEAEELIQEK